MTDRSKQHCDHECVCDDFHPEYDPDYQEICNNKDCEHDTRTHTPAALATEYTIEQIAEIDNRIRKERKAERKQVLDDIITFRKRESKEYKIHDMWVHESEYLESLRGGATDEGGERR